ncbi:MAG: RluA family pseudouridine synthase [Lewinellaceae bacterium]|nr:RluA family pseudouridine synthase [Saprospiraceae bacterium]MCB0542892.1 RluA family pseudouridine synthase [Saprospiraceae bacterium]MCB9305153.1 RluA family pseudouridine synthase [Lewinellaceae bacterium]MCB9355584.1 RluA family pseudouridine synthase [Lewinellaceae bacterium]
MQILFEDYYLLVIDKPAGLSSESGKERHPSAEREALFYFTAQLQERSSSKRLKVTPYLRVAHRLDRAASGILVMAKTKAALVGLMEQFEKGSVEKTYWAVTETCPPKEADTLTHWLTKDPQGRKAVVSEKESRGSQQCRLDYKVLEKRGKSCLLEIKPHTGRFHQIRAQLAFIGHPIKGDVLYGGSPWREHQIMLHARHLQCKHPKTGAAIEVDCPPGEAWRATF